MQRTALVTGGSRGIGSAIVDRLTADGMAVLAPTREELDLSEPASVAEYCHALPAEVDVLVNNAGINEPHLLAEVTDETWDKTLEVNLSAPFRISRALIPQMATRGWGRVINVLSCFSFVSKEGRSAYTAAKTGLLGLTRTLAIEAAPSGVQVNGVAPGFIATEMTVQNNSAAQIEAIEASLPAGRMGEPQEVAAAVSFLAGDDSSYVSGQVLVVDGGFLVR